MTIYFFKVFFHSFLKVYSFFLNIQILKKKWKNFLCRNVSETFQKIQEYNVYEIFFSNVSIYIIVYRWNVSETFLKCFVLSGFLPSTLNHFYLHSLPHELVNEWTKKGSKHEWMKKRITFDINDRKPCLGIWKKCRFNVSR